MIVRVISNKGTNASKSVSGAGEYTQSDALHAHRILGSNMLTPLLAFCDGRQSMNEGERLQLYAEFDAYAARRPDVERPFLHLAIAVHPNDSPICTPENWHNWGDRMLDGLIAAENEIRARKRAERGLTPEEPLHPCSIAWLGIGHDERDHKHMHIHACRVTVDGRLFYGSFLGQSSRPICHAIEDEYGLVSTRTVVGRSPRVTIVRDVAPEAMASRLVVTQAIAEAPSLAWFDNRLVESGIQITKSKRGWRAQHDGLDIGPASHLGLTGRCRPDRLAATLAERSSPHAQLRNRLHGHRAHSANYSDWEARLAADNIHLVPDDQQRLLFAIDGETHDPSTLGFRRGLAPERLRDDWIPPRAKATERIVPPPADALATLIAEVEKTEKKQAEQQVQRSQRPVAEEIVLGLSTVGWRQSQVQGFVDQRAPGLRVELDRQVVSSAAGEQRFADIGLLVVGQPKEGAKIESRRDNGGRWVVSAAGSAAKVVPQEKSREQPKNR